MLSRPDFEKKQIIYIFADEGQKIAFRNDNMVVKDKEGKILHQSTCYRLFLLCIVGDLSITTGLLKRAEKFRFTICLMTTTMRIYQVIGKRLEGNTVLHRKQYEYSGLELGRAIIHNKIDNQLKVVRNTRLYGQESAALKRTMTEYMQKIKDDEHMPRETLLAYEGNAAKRYFKILFGEYREWHGRKPRIKADYINASLDIGYTVLFNFIEALLSIYDFDLYCGVLHTEFYMRKSLVCDLVEPLRPIVDLAARKGINRAQIKESDFELKNHRYVLKWDKSKKYTRLFLMAILERKGEIFLYIQNYYRTFMKRAEFDNYSEFVL